MLSGIGSSVDDGLSVASHNDVREIAISVINCLLGVAFAAITCESFDVVDETLRVCIDDVRDFKLFFVILESAFVFAFYKHLYSHGAMSDISTARFVLFEVLSRVYV